MKKKVYETPSTQVVKLPSLQLLLSMSQGDDNLPAASRDSDDFDW